MTQRPTLQGGMRKWRPLLAQQAKEKSQGHLAVLWHRLRI